MFRQISNATILHGTSLPQAFVPALWLAVVLATATGLAGCGDTCYAGFSINGNGGGTIKVGNPPPACSLAPAPVSMRLTALKSRVCQICTPASRAEHLYVTVKGIQIRADSTDTAHSPNWLELAPDFAAEPRRIDLLGDSSPEILVSGTNIPAGNYREIRLQFSGAPAGAGEWTRDTSCASAGGNCVVFGDGHVEPITFPEDPPELRIPISDTLWLETPVEVRLRLLPQRTFSASGAAGLKPETGLTGDATIFGESSAAEDSPPD